MTLRLRLDVIALIVIGLLLVLLAYERSAMTERQRPSVYSTYDAGANGYQALYNVLAAAGVHVRRFERVMTLLEPSVKTLVITSYETDPSRKPLDQRDTAELRRFVSSGGRLVAIDFDFAGKLDVAPAVGTTLQTPRGGDALALARNRYTQGAPRLRGTIDWTFSFREPRGVPLFANKNGMVAVWYRYGRGEVIAITAPAIFGNAQLRNADNLRFAYNTVAGHGDVAFDEYVHGYSDNLTMWSVLPSPVHAAVWIIVAMVVIALIGANVPFAPPYVPAGPNERDSSDYITAIAELMRRSRRRPSDPDVIWQTAIDWQRRKEHA